MDTREVTVHRVVNIVDRRSPMHRHSDYDRGFQEDMYYSGLRHYQDIGDCHGDSSYPLNDRRYFDEHPNFAFRRNSPPPRNDSSYSQSYGRDDLRHHIGSRSNNRPGPYFRSRGRGSGPPRRPASDRKAKEDHDDYRKSPPILITRDCSPARREAPPPAHGRLGPNTNNRSSSPDRDKGHAHQQPQRKHKSNAATCNTPSSSVETSPHSSASSKEKAPASVAESEEVATASMEPKPAPVEDVKTRRLEAIKAKAQEIEKDYRQDCETFRTVVKMLVAKEPSLENLLQAPLDENLSEIKQRCLDSLRHFVKELDEILEQPSSSEKATSQKTLS